MMDVTYPPAFEAAFRTVIGVEGKFTVDAGGPTMYGITERVARAAGYAGAMQALPLSLAHDIYYRSYWAPAGCGNFSGVLPTLLFDAAVNQGPQTAIELLQEAVGVTTDGRIGPATLEAVAHNSEVTPLFLMRRTFRYIGTAGWSDDGPGWIKRLFTVAISAAISTLSPGAPS